MTRRRLGGDEANPLEVSGLTTSKMGLRMKVSEGTRKGGVTEDCVLGFVEDGMEGWLVFPGLSSSTSGKVSGVQVAFQSSSDCPFLLLDS